ncbi:MAG: hypothetical protein AAFR76_01445 [Planctomycetota bacterium]
MINLQRQLVMVTIVVVLGGGTAAGVLWLLSPALVPVEATPPTQTPATVAEDLLEQIHVEQVEQLQRDLAGDDPEQQLTDRLNRRRGGE